MRQTVLGLLFFMLCLAALGCENAAIKKKTKPVFEQHQASLDKLQKTMKELDAELTQLEANIGSSPLTNKKARSSAMMTIIAIDQVLDDVDQTLNMSKDLIQKECAKIDVSEKGFQSAWNAYWEDREFTIDVTGMKKRLRIIAKNASINSRELEKMVCAGIYRWSERHWPKNASRTYPHEIECYTITSYRDIDGVQFKLAAATKFTMRYGDGYVVPKTLSFEIVLEQHIVFEGQPLRAGTKIRRYYENAWRVVK